MPLPLPLPPWQQNIFSSNMAATGKQLKQSVNVFHNLMLYLLLPTPREHATEGERGGVRGRLTFIVESIYPVDRGTLVVPSEEKEVFRVLDFVSQQQANCFQRLLSSIYIVPKEQVI